MERGREGWERGEGRGWFFPSSQHTGDWSGLVQPALAAACLAGLCSLPLPSLLHCCSWPQEAARWWLQPQVGLPVLWQAAWPHPAGSAAQEAPGGSSQQYSFLRPSAVVQEGGEKQAAPSYAAAAGPWKLRASSYSLLRLSGLCCLPSRVALASSSLCWSKWVGVAPPPQQGRAGQGKVEVSGCRETNLGLWFNSCLPCLHSDRAQRGPTSLPVRCNPGKLLAPHCTLQGWKCPTGASLSKGVLQAWLEQPPMGQAGGCHTD